MNFFDLDLKRLLVLVVVVAVPLLSINISKKNGQTESSWISTPVNWVSSGVQHAYFAFSSEIQGNTRLYLDLIGIKKDNQALIEENAKLRAQLVSLEETRLEKERLAKLLDFRENSKMTLLSAKIISRDLVTDHVTVHINRGTNDGIKSGQAVITTDGVVGYIFRPEQFTSQVLIITDRYAVVDGLIQRSRARGIVEGRGGTKCSLRYVERSEDVVQGDLVVTSGLDNIFPKGFPIARVSKVEKRNQDVSLRVELDPVVDQRKLEEVFIVLNAAGEDYFPEPAATEEIAETDANSQEDK